MTDSHQPEYNPAHDNVADENVARLVSQAYRPEQPDAEFVQRVKGALGAEAERRRRPAVSPSVPPSDAGAPAKWPVLVGVGVMAAALLIWLGRSGEDPRPRQRPSDRNPQIIAGESSKPTEPSGAPESQTKRDQPRAEIVRVGRRGITARPRPEAPPLERLAVGDVVTTSAGQRKRLGLPDGSVLYVNQDTQLRLDESRRIRLDQGEVYVEVDPRHGIAPEGEATFTVAAPNKTVRSLGTHFAVRADDPQTGVVVTQGKVRVDDVEVASGQELAESQGRGPGPGGAVAPAA